MTIDEKGDPIAAAVGTQGLGADISRGYTEEMEHWAWCIRNPAPENLPHCHPKVALGDAVIALVTNIAARQERQIDFKPEWFDPDSDETPEDEKPDVSPLRLNRRGTWGMLLPSHRCVAIRTTQSTLFQPRRIPWKSGPSACLRALTRAWA